MEGDLGSMNFGTDRKTRCAALDSLESSMERTLDVKQSIDHALNTLKAHTYSDRHSHTLANYEELNVAWRVGSQRSGNACSVLAPTQQFIIRKSLTIAHIQWSPYTKATLFCRTKPQA